MDGPRIESIHIERFRGVPGVLELAFAAGVKERPESLFILGENGSGKSSVVDAVEFVLQGGLFGGSTNAPDAPTLRNLSGTKNLKSFVEMTLNDGSTAIRTSRRGERQPSEVPAHAFFKHSRFTVRRRDLALFSAAPENERPAQLVGYSLYSSRFEPGSDDDLKMKNDIELERARKREIEDALALLLRLAPDDFPRRPVTFDQVVGAARAAMLENGDVKRAREVATLTNAWRKSVGLIGHLGRKRKEGRAGANVKLLQSDLQAISPHVTEAFLALCPQKAAIKNFRFFVTPDGGFSIELRVTLASGDSLTPAKVLSEASLDLLALLTLINLTRQAVNRGQGKLLVLDDVFSSIDSQVRSRFAEYLFREFAEWQVILTFHDRLWFEQFRRAALAVNFRARTLNFGRWTSDFGPRIYEAPPDSGAELRTWLDSDRSAKGLLQGAGLLLETVSDYLTVALGTPLPRKLDQLYTIGDMWGPLRKSTQGTQLAGPVGALSGSTHMRNLGAHHIEWAEGLSRTEAEDFAALVLALWDASFCGRCSSFIARRAGGRIACMCGSVIVSAT